MGAWTESGDGAVRWRTRPEVHEGPRLIDSGTLLAEDHYDLGAQAAAVLGPLSIQSELFYKRTQGLTQDFDIYGAYAFVSFFLTGEHRPYKRSSAAFDRVQPNSNFGFVRGKEGRDGGWGAWEAVARWSYYDVAAGTGQDAGKENNLTAGFNWYWNPNMRMMMDWTHGWTQYNVGDDNELDIIGLRMQVDF
jgi:phosphate-selective porin OprO/OprP